MKLALLGYGKMGKEIEKIALDRGHTIGAILDNEEDWILKAELLRSCDVAIEFSIPAVAPVNVTRCFELGIPVVSGTTGWTEQLGEAGRKCTELNGTFFQASNFSIGVNVFFEINRRLAQFMNAYPEYGVSMKEVHHSQKLDSPSGTAITLAKDILASVDRLNGWVNMPSSDEDQIGITSIREGQVPGTHEVIWDSEIDKITLIHEAKNRKGFALGAVLAAEFILGKKGVYGMKQLLNL